MNYPYMKLVLPSALSQHKNGQLPPNLLAKVNTGGQMYAPVAAWFNKMYDAALAAGHKLRNVGDYRSFEGQLSMFMDRYSTTDQGRSPQVTRQYEGKTWYLKPGKAPSAAPDPTGKKGSNHGWGLAIDLGYDQNGKIASFALNSPSFIWMCENAPKYGFYLQTADTKSKEWEAWHWQYCLGDKSPDGTTAPAAQPLADAHNAGNNAMEFKYPGSPVKLGSKGTAAMLVQSVIGAKADGDFGPKSVEALKNWQAANGLKADGVVGPVTWDKMF
jgi:peptidoglycan hydrolase-like protein with peptidoglycan-binding domain